MRRFLEIVSLLCFGGAMVYSAFRLDGGRACFYVALAVVALPFFLMLFRWKDYVAMSNYTERKAEGRYGKAVSTAFTVLYLVVVWGMHYWGNVRISVLWILCGIGFVTSTLRYYCKR